MTDIGGVIGTQVASQREDQIEKLIYLEAPMGDAISLDTMIHRLKSLGYEGIKE